MSEARKQILQMLEDGKVTADQAMELLQALAPAETEDIDHYETDAYVIETAEKMEPLTGEVIQPAEPPNLDRYRRFWQIPFFVSLGALIVSGLGLRSLYQASDGGITFWFVCVWSIFIFTFIITSLAFLSRQAAWLHVRVREKAGKRISISFPLPLGLASWGLNLARTFVNYEERDKLDMAASFLDAARDNLRTPDSEPLVINVDDEDGDQVQIYIG